MVLVHARKDTKDKIVINVMTNISKHWTAIVMVRKLLYNSALDCVDRFFLDILTYYQGPCDRGGRGGPGPHRF